MFDFVGKRKYWFALSGVLVLISLVSVIFWGLNYGIDFTGGSLMEIKLNGDYSTAAIQAILTEQGVDEIFIQSTGNNILLIRMDHIGESQHQDILTEIGKLLQEKGGTVEELRFDSIGPTIGSELKTKALTAIMVVLVAIVLYIAFAFRKVSFPVASWKYGISAIIALAHDVFITVGLFSILGHFFGYQIDSLFVTALLTIMGFSVHDTIVTFDRTRENLFKSQALTFRQIVNKSINETVVRSLNTSLTTLLVLVSVYLFGGASIQQFILALMFGIIIGTYSSLFIASPLLVVWHRLKK